MGRDLKKKAAIADSAVSAVSAVSSRTVLREIVSGKPWPSFQSPMCTT